MLIRKGKLMLGRKRIVPGVDTKRASICLDENTYERGKLVAKQKGKTLSEMLRPVITKFIKGKRLEKSK